MNGFHTFLRHSDLYVCVDTSTPWWIPGHLPSRMGSLIRPCSISQSSVSNARTWPLVSKTVHNLRPERATSISTNFSTVGKNTYIISSGCCLSRDIMLSLPRTWVPQFNALSIWDTYVNRLAGCYATINMHTEYLIQQHLWPRHGWWLVVPWHHQSRFFQNIIIKTYPFFSNDAT